MPKRALCLFKEWALCNVLLRKGLGTTLKATWAVSFGLLLIIKPFPKRDVSSAVEGSREWQAFRQKCRAHGHVFDTETGLDNRPNHCNISGAQAEGTLSDQDSDELIYKLIYKLGASEEPCQNILCLSEYLVSEVLQCLFMTKAGFVCHLRSFRLIWRGWEAVS